ncbi:MAG: prepilin-type N-terminal cleavage/methylation domain-containing protein [Gemmatimonadaceae bacterium]|nr:prepilin-type N-terminal cleavage/methylation domain-containing protein [Gemmatimonadaceae bacterium]
MRATTSRQGFTLIELLIVVVIIGILAAIAVPKYQETKGRAYAASIKSDLKNVSSQQEDYFYYNEQYSNNLAGLNFNSSRGVNITIVSGDARGWSATATHPPALPLVCSVSYGQPAPAVPATRAGVIEVQ